MEQSATKISLPLLFPFPVTVVLLLAAVGGNVVRNQPLLRYRYWEYQQAPSDDTGDEEEAEVVPKKKIRVEMVGTFDCPVDGEVVRWDVKQGQEVMHAGQAVGEIMEPCAHPVQFGGLCAYCGKLVDDKDYLSNQEPERAPVQMTHGTAGLRVLRAEAERVEHDLTTRLLGDKKLVLVVDLDQTVIHATVEPTVREWMQDPKSLEYNALKGVQAFLLEERRIAPPDYKGPPIEIVTLWYYVKLRPGLQEFLERVLHKFEMHIYTMATRAYALEIAKIIDPERKYFGDRILSRDESGNMTQKLLERLFPTDTSLVTVIDDRGDVWGWCDNLIKVVPYDFFVGIGDINLTFLPKQSAVLAPSRKGKQLVDMVEEAMEATEATQPTQEVALSTQITEAEEPEAPSPRNGSDSSESEHESGSESPAATEEELRQLAEADSERMAQLEAQVQERPLAKLQHNLIEMAKEQHVEAPQLLLSDDDTELFTLEKALERVHAAYYRQYTGGVPPRIVDIMPAMKQRVFGSLSFVFSGLLPLNRDPFTADIVVWCRLFGARVEVDPYSHVTHVICKNPGTFKVRYLRVAIPGVKIVHPDWVFACLAQWKRLDETPYLMAEEEGPEKVTVLEREVLRYRADLERRKQFQQQQAQSGEEAQMLDELNVDWDEINKEVDDFMLSEGEGGGDGDDSLDDAAEEHDDHGEPDDPAEGMDDLERELMNELEESE